MQGMKIGSCLIASLLCAGIPTSAGAEMPPMPLARRLEILEFLAAAQSGDIEVVRAGLDRGMPVDAMLPPKDARFPYTVRTPLEAASLYARMDVVHLLLERGATLRHDERHGVYPASMHSGDVPELLVALVERAGVGSDLDASFGPALVRAAANGARAEVEYLLSIGVDADWRSPDEPWDEPAIVRARSHFDIVDFMLAAGADPMGGELDEPWSPLFPAALAADVAWTRRFLAMGIDPQLRGRRGNALSMAACSTPRTARPGREAMERTNEVVALLLDAGVDPNRSFDGRSPLRCAEDSRNVELAAALGAAGARSRDSLWNRVRRGVSATGMALALLLGGEM
jgi:ankyrin repeat protein